MIIPLFRLAAALVLAFLLGKLVAKIKLPSILGWLLAGMILGPHAVGLIDASVLDASWFQSAIHVLECAVGLMIGTEIIWKVIKRSGKQIIVTTLTESLGTFLLVSLTFGVVFYIVGIPLYLALIFGSIALATAPAPSLSIVREFKTNGPVTKTLIPMAALDDIVAVVVFFTVISIVSANVSTQAMPVWMIVLIPVLPLVIGVLVGIPSSFLLKKDWGRLSLPLLLACILAAAGLGFLFNYRILPQPMLNFMLIGMAFSATFANLIPLERLEALMAKFNPILGFALIVVILSLGAPLDYHLILGAGLFTVIYIVSRAVGKYGGAWFGAWVTKSPKVIQRYLGFTLLPHSGVSLVFTGIAVAALTGPAPEEAKIIQGTIAAAAVINEVIAVLLAKKGFDWAGETTDQKQLNDETNLVQDNLNN